MLGDRDAQERFHAEIDALRAENASLASDNASLRAENASFAAKVDVLTRRIDELTQRVGKSSKNSSLPPSSDSPKHKAEATKTRADPSHCQELWIENLTQAATDPSSVSVSGAPIVFVSLLSCGLPSMKVAPARTSGTSSAPVILRQRAWAESSSL